MLLVIMNNENLTRKPSLLEICTWNSNLEKLKEKSSGHIYVDIKQRKQLKKMHLPAWNRAIF